MFLPSPWGLRLNQNNGSRDAASRKNSSGLAAQSIGPTSKETGSAQGPGWLCFIGRSVMLRFAHYLLQVAPRVPPHPELWGNGNRVLSSRLHSLGFTWSKRESEFKSCVRNQAPSSDSLKGERGGGKAKWGSTPRLGLLAFCWWGLQSAPGPQNLGAPPP